MAKNEVVEAKSHLPADINLAEQIKRDLAASAEQVEAATVEKIRMSGRGFKLPDDSTGEKLMCVILDFVSANTHYAGEYDANDPAPPDCYAVGRVPGALAPATDVEEPYAEKCAGCPKNEFGSAKVGKGKACKNTRKLAVMQIGADEDSTIWELNVPPGSIRYFDTYISTTLRGRHQLPASAVVTEIYMDSSKDYASPRFKMDRPLTEEELAFYYGRKQEAQATLLPA